MARLMFLIFITLFTSSISGQVVEANVNKAIENLKKAHIDTFLVYSYSCNGSFTPLDSCLSEDTQYLFWQQNGKTYLRKFDYCKSYEALELNNSNPLTFYLNYNQTIEKEDIKPPTYFEIKTNKNRRDTTINSLSVSHSCFHQYNLHFEKITTEKSVNTYNLNFVRFDNGEMNIYRKENQRTKLYSLVMMTSDLIKTLNNNKTFKTN